jgi:hypothetical protein
MRSRKSGFSGDVRQMLLQIQIRSCSRRSSEDFLLGFFIAKEEVDNNCFDHYILDFYCDIHPFRDFIIALKLNFYYGVHRL